jgi:hypothetical protein
MRPRYVQTVETAPRPPHQQRLARLVVPMSVAVATVVVVAVVVGAELSQTPGVSQAHSYAADPFPPLWTTTVPNDSAFGGVINNLGYYTIVPLGSELNPNFYRMEVVAFSIQDGAILWNSTPISLSGAGNIAPRVVLGSTELYLVGYAANLSEPGAPWNGTGGVFAVGFNLSTGAPGFFTSQLNVAAMQLGEVETSGGMVYTGYAESGTAILQAFRLPGDGNDTARPWTYDLQLPAGFSSNLVFSVEDEYELVLLPASLAVLNASDGSYLEDVPFSDPLDLFDGTVQGGVAYGVNWIGPNLFLQGYQLATGSLAVNVSLGTAGAATCGPFEVTPIGDVLFASTSCGDSWSVYTLAGTYLWTTSVATPVPTLQPIPIGTTEALIYGPLFLSWPPGSPPKGNYSFEGLYALYNLTTGAVIWQESPWFQVESSIVLMFTPFSMSEPPAPAVVAWHSDYVVEWWAGSTSLAAI